MGASPGETNPGIRGWERSASTPQLQGKEGSWRLGHKNSEARFRELQGWCTYWYAGRMACPERVPSSAPPIPIPCPVHLFCLAILRCSLCNKPLTVKCFPNSVSHSSKLSNLMRGSWEPPIYSQLVGSTGGSGLVTGA